MGSCGRGNRAKHLVVRASIADALRSGARESVNVHASDRLAAVRRSQGAEDLASMEGVDTATALPLKKGCPGRMESHARETMTAPDCARRSNASEERQIDVIPLDG